MPSLSDKQKSDLKKHMEKHEGTTTEKRSHRMKMIRELSKGNNVSVRKAHNSIMKSNQSE
jgi:hypothetical protein